VGLVPSLDRARRLLRYGIAWKLCPTMSASDVSDTLELALAG
jgi:hypothetical protein